MAGIDRNRGATIKFHPAGMRVAMYTDAPGEYVDERGQPVSKELAKAAGFDVVQLDREREKNKRMAEFRAKLDAQFADANDRLAAAMTDVAGAGGTLKVKHIGGGQYAVYDGDTRVTRTALNKAEAQMLVSQLAGDEEGNEDGDAQSGEAETTAPADPDA